MMEMMKESGNKIGIPITFVCKQTLNTNRKR